MGKISILLLASVFIVQLLGHGEAWGNYNSNHEKVRIDDVRVITLKQGAMTTGRRAPPTAQLRCVGGTARCEFQPRVVQCYNKGSDGNDVQWECKTDMSNKYRFGEISVSCEGYDYPDDPYILKGSCGLEYQIDFVEGHSHSSHQHHTNDHYNQDYGWKPHVYEKNSNGSRFITNLACAAVVIVIVYAIWKTCIAPNVERQNQRSSTNDDYPDGRRPGTAPPPPGFRFRSTTDDAHQGTSGYGTNSDSCSGSGTRRDNNAGGFGSNAGGFWTGAATGGLLGYMFGTRNNNNTHTQYGHATYRPRPSTSWGSSSGSTWGGFGSSGSSTSGTSSSSSSGSRTTSGFGGTTRR